MYKTELHLHTRGISSCCDCPPEIAAEYYREAGYTTVTVTDHFTPQTLKSDCAPAGQIERFFSGAEIYRALLGDNITVIPAMELRFSENRNDYLVYGIGADFLLRNPDLPSLPSAEGIARIHAAGGLIYQAHPFRDMMTVMHPGGLDGIEVFNAHNHHDSRNELAAAFAAHHALPGIAGSDFHHVFNRPTAGILTQEPIRSNDELLRVLRCGDYKVFGTIYPYGK